MSENILTPKCEASKMEEDEELKESETRKVWKLIRPKNFKIADEDTKDIILNPPPRFPAPEFKGLEYVHGPETESSFVFMCNEPGCEAKFTTDLGLTLHTKKHCSPDNKCQFCGLLLRTKDDLSKHTSDFHPDLDLDPDANPLQCQKCKKTSKSKHALWRHVRESHRDRKYPCSQCNFEFTRPENLKAHMQTLHPSEGQKTKHICKICGMVYGHKNSLRLHIKNRHRGEPETTYRCVLCSTVYSNKQCYQQHMRRHENPVSFPCHACNLKFRSASHLKRHEACKDHIKTLRKIKKKNPDALFPVPVIKTVKTENPSLTKEELTELCKKTQVKIIINKLDDGITTRSIAKDDKRKRKLNKESSEDEESEQEEVADDDKYLNCIYCEKELPDLESVKTHENLCYMKIKSKKLNICSICNKEFDKPYTLKLHSRVHSEDRPFKCSFCDSYFKSDYTKTNHEKYAHFDIRTTYVKNYKCTHEGCSRVFTNHTSLKEHLIIHSGIKFTCEQCGRLFSRESSLKKHLANVHAECPILLECKPCNRTYKDRLAYLRHLEKARHAKKCEEYEEKQYLEKVEKKKRKKKSKGAGNVSTENFPTATTTSKDYEAKDVDVNDSLKTEETQQNDLKIETTSGPSPDCFVDFV